MMEGTPTYTQRSVAFPDLKVWPSRRGEEDDFTVSFEADGGGTYGEFVIEVYKFTQPRDAWACRWCIFSDGMEAFRDERVQKVVDLLHDGDQSPDGVRQALESGGFVPSNHHKRGMEARRRFPDAETITADMLYQVPLEGE
jgi:hypothetical protein